jgi:hypothetical protein
MHIIHRGRLLGRVVAGLAISAWCGLLIGCAPLVGYPKDPENTEATLAALAPYFNGIAETDYLATADVTLRTGKRNGIVLVRMRAYDIEFSDFERSLYGEGNEATLGSDLVGLILGGLTATTGNAATKAALGAASAGVIGAKAAIDKDLYYQKTIPALLAQMEADRLSALLPITAGLKLPDANYPLMQAYIDLDAYKNAGSIPAAINAFNKNSGIAKDRAQAAITFQRGPAYIAQFQNVVTVQTAVRRLAADSQFVKLAQLMQPYLTTRPSGIQQIVKVLDPANARLRNGPAARQVINAWIGEEDMTPTNQRKRSVKAPV